MKFRRNGSTWQHRAGQLVNVDTGDLAQGYFGDDYYINGVLSYDSNAEDDQTLYTEEEIFTAKLYGSALEELVGEDLKYSSNYNMYNRWEPNMQLWWIKQVEAQAQAGKQTIGVDVVTRATIIRLTRS